MVLIKLLIGTGLYVGALVSNVYWLVKHIASAGEEVRKHREEGRDYTRYSSYYGYTYLCYSSYPELYGG